MGPPCQWPIADPALRSMRASEEQMCLDHRSSLQDGVMVSECVCYIMRNMRGPLLQVPTQQRGHCQEASGVLSLFHKARKRSQGSHRNRYRYFLQADSFWGNHVTPVNLTLLGFSSSLSTLAPNTMMAEHSEFIGRRLFYL